MELTPHHLRRRLAQLPAARRYRVAYSGGRDSHVLLHCLRAVQPQATSAVHVHHGLHPEADRWAEHCVEVCAKLNVTLDVIEVNAHPAAGQSPEAAAREARYRALAECLGHDEALLTAHHRNDQAETLLLQLLRGAGPRGLAAMPAHCSLGAGLHLRPLLEFPRAALADYAARLDLNWVEDHSNLDLNLDRNFLRHRVAPVLAERWPAWDATLARAAVNSSESAMLAEALGHADLQLAVTADPLQLDLAALRRLDRVRRANVVRVWLQGLGVATPARAHMQRLLDDVVDGRVDAEPVVHWAGVELRRYRERLYAMAPLAPHDPNQCIPWSLQAPLPLPALEVCLSAVCTQGRGVRADALVRGDTQVRFRRGGERLRPVGSAHHRELKTLFQEAGVAPWQRARIPLLYVGDQLAAVGDLWVEHALAPAPDQWGYELVMKPLEDGASH